MTIEEALKKDVVWAVLGATPKENKFGFKLYKRLKSYGYEVYPVNPNAEQVDGDICYSTLTDIPKVVDIVNVVVPEQVGVAAMSECEKLGISTVWLQPGADTDAVINAAKERNINVIIDCVLVQLP
ncbi:CoA-binding protein [Veillonella montpellierensis DNF00314]|uniref:CoA-binding protein n=1 Tax=Veillonella montpellierensis DNF00314 TaxID=1401067 RepID=A0A096CS38_9FIRM|nr:CoA-binding protein [Veillonella montpellierensis]KGF48159.1 CoA-binding protein [Veillonella montpellierensis DNF00314]